jgi:hypothetical protein
MQIQSSSKVRWLVISSKRPGIIDTQRKKRKETKRKYDGRRHVQRWGIQYSTQNMICCLLHNRQQKKNVKRRKQGKRKEEIRRKDKQGM